MTTRPSIMAKATSPDTRSDAIVVSFDYRWYTRMRARAFSAVIRKRMPTSTRPSWLYIHVNAPKSAICARAAIAALEHRDLASALALSDVLALSPQAIASYVADAASIGVYRLRRIEFARTEVTTALLAHHMRYSPPQSFLVLSLQGKHLIDRLCGFRGNTVARRAVRSS